MTAFQRFSPWRGITLLIHAPWRSRQSIRRREVCCRNQYRRSVESIFMPAPVIAVIKAELTCSRVAVPSLTFEQQLIASDHAGLLYSPRKADRKSAACDTDEIRL